MEYAEILCKSLLISTVKTHIILKNYKTKEEQLAEMKKLIANQKK